MNPDERKCFDCGTIITNWDTITEGFICYDCQRLEEGDKTTEEKENIINALVQDYTEYLEDYTLKQLELIARNGVFTFKEALRHEQADGGL